MDFITKLPRIARGIDSIWVIIDRLTKSAHFISTAESIYAGKLADIYVREEVFRNEVPVLVVFGLGCSFHLQVLEEVS